MLIATCVYVHFFKHTIKKKPNLELNPNRKPSASYTTTEPVCRKLKNLTPARILIHQKW